MAKSEGQRLKLLYIAEILKRETDDNNGITTQEIISALAKHNITAERKSIYTDIAALEDFGFDIIHSNEKVKKYYLANQDFELPELKLLVDAVQSCKFLSARKSSLLISKLQGLTSRHQARELQRQVFVANRAKSINESIYYTIDSIHAAITNGFQIKFKYFSWTINKTQEFRHNGSYYNVSPYALVWDDEMYYLVAFDEGAQEIRHYRVDKMSNISVESKKRNGQELFEKIDMAKYTKATFGMFGGKETEVELQFSNRLAGAIIDRFGKELSLIPMGDSHFRIRLNVIVSPQFIGFIAGFGSEAKILSPQSVVDQFVSTFKTTLAQYD